MPVVVLAHQAPSAKERFRDAAAVAFVALLLGIPMLGLTLAQLRQPIDLGFDFDG